MFENRLHGFAGIFTDSGANNLPENNWPPFQY